MKVAVLMGSDSDWNLMRPAVETLKSFGIESEVEVASAHRTPAKVRDFVMEAPGKGVGAFIVGAGGAAHLAGVLASSTVLPVIGIPVAGGALNGLDALYATVQMPGGVPVATVAVGSAGPVNAALLAVQILGTADAALREKFHAHKAEIAAKVAAADKRIQERGA